MKLIVLCLSLLGIFGSSIAQNSEPNPAPATVEEPLPFNGPPPGSSRPLLDEQKLNELAEIVRTYFHKLDGQANGGNLELRHIFSATHQTVAGTLYNIYAEINENNSPVNCTIKLLEQPWLNHVKLDLECGAEKRPYAYESPSTENAESDSTRGKRQSLGGYQNIGPNGISELEPKLKTIFEKLRSQYEDFDFNFVRVEGGRYQVVSGTHYIVNVEASQKSNDKQQRCEADILENLKGDFDRVDVKCAHPDKSFRYVKQ